jgi:glycosyltransferase involved in cell wall biosynthesis
MKILYVLDVFPVAGGAETVTRTLGNELAARGHEVHVACFRESRGIDVFVDPRVVEHLFPVRSPKLDRRNVAFLHRLLEENRIDVVVSQSLPPPDCGVLCHQARQGTRARLVQCYHGALLFRLKYKKLRPLLRFVPDRIYRPWKTWREMRIMNGAYDRSDRLVLLSTGYVRQYAGLCPDKDLGRLLAIPNPFPLPESVVDVSTKERTLLFVGRIQESVKRLGLVLEAWRRLGAREGNSGWKLVVVGDGPDMEQLRRRARGLPRVSIEGFQDPVPYYRAAAVSLMTSAFEGFPMTLVEAQQNGCVPVVMDSFLAVRDIVEDGRTGRIVPDGDVDAMVDAVQELMDDSGLRSELARSAMEASRRYGMDVVAGRWESLFSEVVG